MRYEELSLPLAQEPLRIRFHPHVTVLAGLTGANRAAFIDAFVAAAIGQAPGGSLVYLDRGGRRIDVHDQALHFLDAAPGPSPAPIDVRAGMGEMRSLLVVGAEDLGLPRPLDDPIGLARQTELLTASDELERARQEREEITVRRTRRARLMTELEQAESTLADLGTAADRAAHNRARTLVELERIRSVITAVDASKDSRRRDDLLLVDAQELQSLADEWSAAVKNHDQLMIQFRDHPRLDSAQLTELADAPESISPGLRRAIVELDQTSTQRDRLAAAVESLRDNPRLSSSSDPRVLALATVDQDQLWMAHRHALLATDALEAASSKEAKLEDEDARVRSDVEDATAEADAAANRAERRSLPGIIATTVLLFLAVLLPAAGFGELFLPTFAVAAIASFFTLVQVPKLQSRRATHAAEALLQRVGATNIHQFRQRFTDNPTSPRWQNANRIVGEYESAMAAWHALVGDFDIREVGALEDDIHLCVATLNPQVLATKTIAAKRNLAHAQVNFEEATRRLEMLIAPFGLTLDKIPPDVSVESALGERIALAAIGRLQREIGEAEELERKYTNRLDSHLCSIGFEDGSLEARIGAYGWALEDARQRAQLRAETKPLEELTAARDALEAQLEADSSTIATVDDTAAYEGVHITELRQHREDLRAQAAQITIADSHEVQLRIMTLEGRIAVLEQDVAPEAGVLVSRPVDHLVDTLVRFRPTWPTSTDDPLPAVLNDPFGAAPTALRGQLLDALLEVAQVTQIILLTDDTRVTNWARSEAAKGHLSLIEPSRAGA